jgi:hypothetical protein
VYIAGIGSSCSRQVIVRDVDPETVGSRFSGSEGIQSVDIVVVFFIIVVIVI